MAATVAKPTFLNDAQNNYNEKGPFYTINIKIKKT